MRISLVFLSFLFYFWANISAAIEEPSYRVISANGMYEVREYEDRIAVQTIQNNGQNGAFRKLFKYISGSNTSSRKIDMTAPVTQSVEIDKTLPIAQKLQDGKTVMQFFLPSKFKLEQAPQPLSEDLSIVVVKRGKYAVIKYTGRSTFRNFEKHSKILIEALSLDKVKTVGPPIKATFDGPLTPFFLRRNEVMIRVK
tara:strand:- start:134 stop:724 length:591 start_codon:yes stop_codon:yes gene_type:complete